MRVMLIAALVAMSTAAPAQTDKQANTVALILQATALSNKCGQSHVDTGVLGAVMVMHDLTVEDISEGGAYAEVVRHTAINADRDLADASAIEACALAKRMFGKQGAQIPDLVVLE